MRKFLISFFLLLSFPAFAADASLPFHVGSTITVAVTTSASAAAVMPVASQPSWQVELQNGGANTAFCSLGGSTVVATTASYPILAGGRKIITVDQDQKFISCITGTSTATVYVTGGVGR